MRSYLKENHFKSNEHNHKKTAKLSTALLQNDPRGYFKAWMACMKLYVVSEVKYFDVKKMDTIIAFINYSETHETTPIRAFFHLRHQNNLIPKCSHIINIKIALLISFSTKQDFPPSSLHNIFLTLVTYFSH
jgi:hypothetical protein